MNLKYRPPFNKIFILPNKDGFIFICIQILIVLVSILYDRNITYVVLSLAFTQFLSSLVMTHFNLDKIKVHDIFAESSFTGSKARIKISLQNLSKKKKYNIGAKVHISGTSFESNNSIYIDSKKENDLIIEIPLTERGVYTIEKLTLYSSFPIGFFRTFTYKKVNIMFFSYPTPMGRIDLDPHLVDFSNDIGGHSIGGDDFYGHKTYEKGDSYRHLDWKLLSRTQNEFIKIFDHGASESIIFKEKELIKKIGVEKALSQITLWVRGCIAKQLPFKLYLENIKVFDTLENKTYERCFERLSVYGLLDEQ